MQRMNSLLSGLARTFSTDLRVERQNALRSVPSFNEFESHSSADMLEQQQAAEAQQGMRCQSLPSRLTSPQLHTAGSVSDSETSFSVGSPGAGSMDSPRAACTAEAAGPAKQAKKPYKINGMDAYDYWSLIKSL